ncbi:MAG: LPD38 domain-containing protein [Bacteroidota bacterium]|nr:LPD38 domain-containing protein [Bacteroidota bacterium]
MDKPDNKESNALDGFFNSDPEPTDPTNNPLDDFFKVEEPQNDPLDDFFKIDEESNQSEIGISALGRPKKVEDFNFVDKAINGILSFAKNAIDPIKTEQKEEHIGGFENAKRAGEYGSRNLSGGGARGIGNLFRFMTSVGPGSDLPMTWNPNNKEQTQRAYEKRLKNEDVGGQLIKYADKQKYKASQIDFDHDHWTGIAGQVVPYTAGTITAIALAPAAPEISLGIGAANISMLGLSSFGSGIDAYDEYKEQTGGEKDPMARLGIGALYGASEFAMERIQLNKFLPKGLTQKAGKLFFGSVPEEIVERKGKDLIEKFAKSTPQRGQLVSQYLKSSASGSVFEGSTELATEIAQEFTNWLYYEAEDKEINQDFFERLTGAYIGGSMMGGAIGPLSYGSQQSANRRRREKAGQVVLAQNKTTGEALEIIAPKSSKDESAAKVYQAVKPNGKVVEVSEEELSDLIQLPTESFNAILQGKADAEALISEKDNADLALTAAEQRAQIELATSDMVFRDELGNETLQPAMLDGEQYYITGFDPNNPDLVFIKNQEGVTKGLSRNMLEIQEPIPYQQWLDDNSGISNQAPFDPANPIQIGEEVDIDIMGKGGLEMHSFKVSGLDRESGQIQLESTTEDGYFETVDIETFNQYRKEQSTSDLETSQKLEEIFNVGDEVELEAPEQVEEQADIKEIDLGKRKVKIQTDPNGNMRVLTDKVMTKTQAKSLATSIKNKFSRLQFEVVDETNPDDPFSPDSFALVFKNPANNIPDGRYLKNGEEISREGAIQLIEQGSFENLEINNDSELKNRLTKAKKEAQAPEASQLLNRSKDEKMEAIHKLIDRFNKGEEALRPDIDLLAEDLKVNVIKKTRAGKDIAIADRKSGQVINPKPVQNENAEIQQDEQKTAIEENEGQSNQQEDLQAKAQEVDPNQSTSPEQTQERKQSIINFIGQDPQNYFGQLGLKMPAGKRKKAMFEDMASESPSPEAQELLSQIEAMANSGYIDYHHEGGGVESIPIDDFFANTQEEAAPEDVQSEMDRVIEEFTDENGNLKLDELEKQDDGFFTQFPFSLNTQELHQLRQIISNERAAQTTGEQATGETVDSSQQQEPQTPEASVDDQKSEGASQPGASESVIGDQSEQDLSENDKAKSVKTENSKTEPFNLEKRNIWIPNMKPSKLKRLLGKTELTENDYEDLKDFQYFLLTDETSAIEKGFKTPLLASQRGSASVFKDKFVLTNIRSKLDEYESKIEQSQEPVTDSRGEASKKVGQNEELSKKDQVEKRSAEINYQKLQEKGFLRVAQPQKVADKIYKYLGIEVEVTDTGIRLYDNNTVRESEAEYVNLVYGSEAKRNQAVRKTYQQALSKRVGNPTNYRERQEGDSGNGRKRGTTPINRQTRGSVQKNTGKIVPRTVLKSFKDKGRIDFSGVQINNSQDVADYFSLQRSPYIEKFQVMILDKDGKVIANFGKTDNLQDQTSALSATIINNYKSVGAKSVYIMHNHPSGDHQVSKTDIIQTKAFAEKLDPSIKFNGHVVINSEKYSLIDAAGRVKELDYKSKPQVLFSEREKVDHSEKAAEISAELLKREGIKQAVIYLDTKFRVAAFDSLPSDLSDKQVRDTISKGMDQNLGNYYILVHDGLRERFMQAPEGIVDMIDVKSMQSQQFTIKPRRGPITQFFEKKEEYNKQTDSPEFKAWFGDSKVVDEEGNPLVVYHGTNKEFNEFKSTKFSTAGYFSQDPVYATSFAKTATLFKGGKENVKSVYLKIERPFDVSNYPGDKEFSKPEIEEMFPILKDKGIKYGVDRLWGWMGKDEVISAIKEAGYDGVFFNEMSLEFWKENDLENEMQDLKTVKAFIAFEPTQIKSATENQGTFDPSNPDIRFKKLQPTGRSIESEQVEDQVSKLTKDWKNAPKVNIYRNIDEMVNDVPELRPYVSNRVAALYHKGQVFINAAHPKHRVHKGTEKILLHEVIGHHGVRGFVQKYAQDFKTEWENILENTFERNKEEPIMSKLAFTYFGKTLDNITQDEMFELAEEYIAHAAESSPSNSLMARIRRFFRRMLNKLGIKTRFTNDDLNELIRNAYRFVQNENGEVKRRIDVQLTIRYFFGPNYRRVIPRDFFNESKLITMYSRFASFYNEGKLPEGFEVNRISDEFEASLSEEGEMYSGGVEVYYNGEPVTLTMTYNSGKTDRFPLYITQESNDVWGIPVFNSDGELDSEFIEAYGEPSGQTNDSDASEFFYDQASYLKQMGVVGLWHVDGLLSPDFEFDVDDFESGFDIREYEDGMRANNLISRINGSQVDFYIPEGEKELHFKHNSKTGKVIDGSREMTSEFRELFAASPKFNKSSQTDTPEFKKWFGNSKVVDENGEPLVVYHGSESSFNVFNQGGNSWKGKADQIPGMYFTDNRDGASFFALSDNAKYLRPFFLSIQNPLEVKNKNQIRELYNVQNLSEAFEEIRKNYDGLIIQEGLYAYGGPHKEIIAFEPTQIKLAKGNNGQFDANNPDIRFKLIPESELHDIEKHTVEESEAKQRNRLLTNFNKNSETWTKFTEAIQDNMVRGKRLIDQKQGDKVKDSSNFYVKENLAKGRTLEQTERFMGELYKPLLKTGREMNKKHKVKITEISDYLYALHAPERNAFIAENNPKAPENPSGMSNEEAEQIVKAFEAKVPQELRDQLTDQVKAINNFVNSKRLASGLISKEVYEQLQNQYEHYVPLRGWEDIQDEDSTVYSPLIAAKGRSSKAANVIPYLVTAAQEAIMKGEANMVRQSLLEFVKENPDANQYQIRNAWYKKTGEQDAAGNDIWEETLDRPTKEDIESGNAYRSYNQEIQRAIKSGKPGENVISVMVNGKKVYIEFKRPELAKAIKNISSEKVPKLLAWLRSYTRWLSSMYTQYSPEFGIRNLIRDFGFGSFNAIAESGFKNWGKMSMEIPQSMWSLTRYFATGKFPNTIDSRGLKEFIEAGGLTGYSDLKQAKEIYSKAEKEINRLDRSGAWNTAKSMTATGTKAIFKPVEVYNRVLENAVRFAYFKSLRTDGLTPQQAAIKAKDLTVNFNRKGNSSSVLGTIFMFFNASVQGNERLFRNLMSPKTRKKASVMIGSIIAAGFAQGMLFGLMDDDDEDGEKFYNKVPDYIKRTHIVIPNLFSDNKGEYLKIPLPYGINVFYSSGEQLASVLLGSQKPTDASLGLMTAASDSFSPVGGFDFEGDELNIWQKLVHFSTPSVASPITDLAFNRTFTGAPIAREPFIQGQPELPDSEQYFPSVNPAIKNVTDALNKATGGDNVQPGWLSINPEWVEHGMRSYFGGPIQFAENTSKTITTAMQGESIWEDPNYRKIPFFRNYVQKSGTDYQARQEYYEKYNELSQINFHLNQYIDNNQTDKAKEYIRKNRNEIRLFQQAERYNKTIKKLNKSIAALNEDGGFNESVDQLYDQRAKLYKQFNKLYNEVMNSERPKTLNEIFR